MLATRILGLTLATFLVACASGGAPQKTSSTAGEALEPPAYFVEDPVTLLPNVQVAIAFNFDRVRDDPELYRRICQRLYEALVEDDDDQPAFETLMRSIRRVYLGLTHFDSDDPKVVMVVRGGTDEGSLEQAIRQSDSIQLTPGERGFLHAKLDDGDDFVLVDQNTLIIYEAILDEAMKPILDRSSTMQFYRSPLYETLANQVGFGTAAAALIGEIKPETLERLTDEAPPQAGPLVNALRTIDSFGIKIGVRRHLEVDLSAHTVSPHEASKLVGMLDLLRQAFVNQAQPSPTKELIRTLRIRSEGPVIQMQLIVPMEVLEQLLEENVRPSRKPGIKTT